MQRPKIHILMVLLVFAISVPSYIIAQEKPKSEKAQKRTLKKQRKENSQEVSEAYEDGIKHHYDIQDKKTRKRIKKNLRKSNKKNKNRRKPFWNKWFD